MTLEQLKLGQSLQYPISPQDKQRLADWLDQHLAETIKLALKQRESEKESSKESEWHRLDALGKSIAKELFHAKSDDQLEIWNRLQDCMNQRNAIGYNPSVTMPR